MHNELAHHPVEKWTYYQTTSECLVVNTSMHGSEYLNAPFFSVILFVYVLHVLKALFKCKLGWKVE